MGHRAGTPARRAGSLLLAVLSAVALAASPPAARTALAASDPLRTEADATYTLDLDSGRVHVAIDVTATSLKPNSASFIYYYRSIGFPLQPEASAIRVSGGASSVSTTRHPRYVQAIVRLRANLYYRESTHFTIRYDLVGGAPRSTSPVRVGKAFSTFGVWAWGDVGRSTVEVHLPAGYTARVDGGPFVAGSGASGQTLLAEPDDPDTFFAIVTAENLAAYRETRISFGGGVEVVVVAWPEDDAWSVSIGDTLRATTPKLLELIGLDWPVAHDLDVRERYTPALEGYAGVFFNDDQHIDVSEDLDPVVITHETSHAWFNDTLFSERWIYEGLAEEYAWRTLESVGAQPGRPATKPEATDPGLLFLEGWIFPQVIRDQATDDHERYGYQAAFWVVHQIVDAVGVERMRDAFAGAADHLTAYPGSGTREVVDGANDWRRLLDLVSPIDVPDPVAIDAVLIEYGAYKGNPGVLANRHAARDDYRALIDRGGGWLPPWFVRKRLGAWTFVAATQAMDAARAILDLRDQVETAAGALDLTTSDALQSAYEGAQDSLDLATSIAHGQLDALVVIEAARAKVDGTQDLVTQLGLIGETPRTSYEGARNAFEAGDTEHAVELAKVASSIVDGAAAVGGQRLIIAAVTTAGVVLLLVLLAALLRRRARRRAVAAEPYATLAADPATMLPNTATPTTAQPSSAQDEGGHAPGDSPADP